MEGPGGDSGSNGVSTDTATDQRVKPIIEAATLKAFVAGLVIGNLNKGVLLGFTIGILGGVYVQQNIAGVPDVTNTWKDLMKRWTKTGGSNSS